LNVGKEHIAFLVEEELYNFNTLDACNAEKNDERLIFYDWLADSAMTSHVTHQCEAFTTYMPSANTYVTGVGGKEATIAGQGTIELILTYNGQSYTLLLENVLHMPRTQNNLILLGRWDAAGGHYMGGGEVITLSQEIESELPKAIKLAMIYTR
jgi:hypothetical protein